MSAHVNHAARSIELLNWVDSSGGTIAPSIGAVVVGAAQTHATLALAEQQRIANLIEVAKWNDAALNAGARTTNGQPFDFDAERARVDAIFAQVHEGLGL